MAETKIYLIRHAEAEGNLYRRAQGQYDSTITHLGRRQLVPLAERFRDIPLDLICSSDLTRARSTASALTATHPETPVRVTPGLREVAMGVWEDTPWGDLGRDWPEQMLYFAADPDRWHIPDGESVGAVAERMEQTLLELAALCPGGALAAVSHGTAIRSLLCRLLGVPSAEVNRVPHGDNTSVSLLIAENGALRVEYANDSSHVPPELSTFARQAWWRKEAGGTEDADNLFFSPLRFPEQADLYVDCYRATWKVSHGNINGFSAPLYVCSAQRHIAADPLTLVQVCRGDRFVGLIELDPMRGAEDAVGWISLLYVLPELRLQRLGVQLLGHAVSYFRQKGRRALRLHVSHTNTNALAFYEHCGFHRVCTDQGVGGALWLMEMPIEVKAYILPLLEK